MSKKVLMPLADGFEEIEAVSVIDILRRAGVGVTIAGVGRRHLKSAREMSLIADLLIDEVKADDFDLIVLPGGHDNAMTLASDRDVQSLIGQMRAQGKWVAALCAAPVALKNAGAIEGVYTCYPGYETQIGEGYTVKAVVETGRTITSRGPGTAAAFAFALVAKLCGEEKAQALREKMLFS